MIGKEELENYKRWIARKGKYPTSGGIESIIDSHLSALAVIAEKEKEIEGLRLSFSDHLAQERCGVPYDCLRKESLMAIDELVATKLKDALAELESDAILGVSEKEDTK